MGAESYCREIEAYLCRKNAGHLIRVVGPAFDMVSRWEADGVPLKVAFSGIDRCVERRARKGPGRRPVRIEFCEADVLDVFDEWRRAVGVPRGAADEEDEAAVAARRRRVSAPAHLERALLKLTSARASGRLGVGAETVLDGIAQELDELRQAGRASRGAARRELALRLKALDRALMKVARETLDVATLQALEDDARAQLSAFRDRMSEESYAVSAANAVDALVRNRLGLPVLDLP